MGAWRNQMLPSRGDFLLLVCIFLAVRLSSSARFSSTATARFSSNARISIAGMSTGRSEAALASNSSIGALESGIHDPGIVLDSKRFDKWLREKGIVLRWDPYGVEVEPKRISILEYLQKRIPEEMVEEITGLKIFLGPHPELQVLQVEVIGPNQKCEELDVTVSNLREGDYFHGGGVNIWSRFAGVKGTERIFLSPQSTGQMKTFVVRATSKDMISDSLVKKAECSKDAKMADIWKFMYPSIRHHFRGFDSIPDTFTFAMSEIMALPQDKVLAVLHENESMQRAASSSSLLEEKAATQSIVLNGQDFRTNCVARKELLKWDDLKEYLSTQFVKPADIAKVEGLILFFHIPKADRAVPSIKHAKVNPDTPKPDFRSPRLISTTLLGPVRLCEEVEVDASSLLLGDIYTLSLSSGPWARVVSEDPFESFQPMTSRNIYGKWYIDPVIQAIKNGSLKSFTFEEGIEVTNESLFLPALGFLRQYFINFAPRPGTVQTKVWKASCSKSATLNDMWELVYPSARRNFENMGVIPPSFKEVMLAIMETPVADLPELVDEVMQGNADFEEAEREYAEAQGKIAAQRRDAERERAQKRSAEEGMRRVQETSRNLDSRFASFFRPSACTNCAQCRKCHRCKGRWCSPTSFKCYDGPTRSKYLDCTTLDTVEAAVRSRRASPAS